VVESTERFDTIEDFAQRWLGRGREDFIATIRCPILIHAGAPEPDATSPFATATLPMPRLAGDGFRIYLVQRCRTNPFVDTVTVGRAPNNDVVLAYPCVSKFHAFFRAGSEGLSLVDAGSTNGTHVDETRLLPATPRLLQPERASAAIRFGTIGCVLVSPAEFWSRVVSRLGLADASPRVTRGGASAPRGTGPAGPR
jgi:hypothetical protein